jgi:hypothetical protein
MCEMIAQPGQSNATTCSTSTLKDPGTCCAEPGWPSTGNCECWAFLCYVNQGGGKDCSFEDLGANGAEVPTTTATGAVCCVWGDASTGFICSCYSDATMCQGPGQKIVSSCSIDEVPPCSGGVETGYSQVPSCR